MATIDNFFRSYWQVLVITAGVRIILLLYTFYINPTVSNIFYSWVRWDGPHYIDLASKWYQTTGVEALWIVFYPLYPLFIKVFNFLINDFQTSSIIVSIFFSFTASIFLYKLTILDFGKKVALLSVWFLNIFPTSYFLQASYTESLFLTMTLATIYFYRKDENLCSGIFGALSSATRVNGVLLLPLLFLEGKVTLKKTSTFILAPLGFLGYLLINKYYFGEFLYFTKPLFSNWYKKFELPWVSVAKVYQAIPPISDPVFYAYFTEFITLIFISIVSIYVLLKVRKSYGIYMILNLLLFTSTSFVISTPRYIIALFPMYIAFATIKNKILLSIISLFFLGLLFYFSQFYIKGQWAF